MAVYMSTHMHMPRPHEAHDQALGGTGVHRTGRPRPPASDACGGPSALNRRHAPAAGLPLGPLAGACGSRYQALATTGRGFLVLACCWRRPRAHRQRASPAPAPRGWRPRVWPCCPMPALPHARVRVPAPAAGHGSAAGPGMCARPPGEEQPPHRPVAAPQRQAHARGAAPSAGAAAQPRQERGRSPRPAGDGCAAASKDPELEGVSGQASNPRAPLEAGRAAGATGLSVLEFPASRGRPRPAEVDSASMLMESSD